MPTLTDSLPLVTQALVDLLISKWMDIGLASQDDVYYGDQFKYPRFAAIAVEAAPVDRDLQQTGLQQRITFTHYFLIYHGSIRDLEGNRKEADQLTHRTITVLNQPEVRQLDGLIIHGHVDTVEPGYANRGGALLVTDRLTWTGLSNYTMPRS